MYELIPLDVASPTESGGSHWKRPIPLDGARIPLDVPKMDAMGPNGCDLSQWMRRGPVDAMSSNGRDEPHGNEGTPGR